MLGICSAVAYPFVFLSPPGGAQDMTQLIRADYKRWMAVIKAAGIRLE